MNFQYNTKAYGVLSREDCYCTQFLSRVGSMIHDRGRRGGGGGGSKAPGLEVKGGGARLSGFTRAATDAPR